MKVGLGPMLRRARARACESRTGPMLRRARPRARACESRTRTNA